jgi:hypothetical protein
VSKVHQELPVQQVLKEHRDRLVLLDLLVLRVRQALVVIRVPPVLKVQQVYKEHKDHLVLRDPPVLLDLLVHRVFKV